MTQREESLDKLLGKMQADMVKYLEPGNTVCGRDWFINRIIWHLDGPEQRAAIALPVQPAKAVHQMRQIGAIEWAATDADRETALRRMPHWQGKYEFRTLYNLAQPATSAKPATERNFCDRCGKRLSDSEYIHTCSLPESKS